MPGKYASLAIVAGAASVAVLSGCSDTHIPILSFITNPEPGAVGDGRVTTSGGNQLMSGKKDFEEFDAKRLIAMLSDEDNPKMITSEIENLPVDSIELKVRLEVVLKKFGGTNVKGENKIRRRNEIQDEMMAASQQRCNLYEQYLRRVRSHSDFLFGAAATILSGAGALATGIAGQILSGTGSITSGVGAEFDRDLFSSVTTQVIIPAIEVRRDEIKKEIVKERDNKDLEAYTITAALQDAIRYHGACTLDTGLKTAAKAIDQSVPGSASLAQVIAYQKQSKELADLVHGPSLEKLQTDALTRANKLIDTNAADKTAGNKKNQALAVALKLTAADWNGAATPPDPVEKLKAAVVAKIMSAKSVDDLTTNVLNPISKIEQGG